MLKKNLIPGYVSMTLKQTHHKRLSQLRLHSADQRRRRNKEEDREEDLLKRKKKKRMKTKRTKMTKNTAT